MVAGNYFEDLITLNLLDDGNSSFLMYFMMKPMNLTHLLLMVK